MLIQKRGLPHAHIILFLDERFKNSLRNSVNVDNVISAEIPPPEDDELRKLVLTHMMHKPCNIPSMPSVCKNIESKSSKKFPKAFRSDTGNYESEYYILYKRCAPDI